MPSRSSVRFAVLALPLFGAVAGAHAESNKIQAQYWIDLSTTNMTIPGMPEETPSGGGGFLGNLIGNAMGNKMSAAMGISRGKSMNTELWVRAKPAGVEGSHAIPAAMNMGEALPLMPIRPVKTESAPVSSDEPTESKSEKPKGRILMYWGCGEEVRKGQPKILDFASQNYAEFAQFFASSHHGRVSKGTQGKVGDSVWPNEKDSKPVPENASLQGAHAVTGDGVPATLKFNVEAANDFLPKAKLSAGGQPQDSIALSWNAMDNAKGYFLQATGGGKTDDGGSDLILWSSSELPDIGWGLMGYQSPSEVAKLVQKKVVLAPGVSTCAVPKGIFAKAQGAVVNMIAYGPELNVSYPPKPQKAPSDWQPDWTARVRVKSTGMTVLGANNSGKSGRRNAGDEQQSEKSENKPEAPSPVNLLKGLFGK